MPSEPGKPCTGQAAPTEEATQGKGGGGSSKGLASKARLTLVSWQGSTEHKKRGQPQHDHL
eukprot:5358061-Prorocentrum_lima.AAC.1